MSNLEEAFELEADLELRVRPRETETVALRIPKEALASLQQVADQRDDNELSAKNPQIC